MRLTTHGTYNAYLRFLRDELEVLAAAQEQEAKKAQLLGCTRFEPMEKVICAKHYSCL